MKALFLTDIGLEKIAFDNRQIQTYSGASIVELKNKDELFKEIYTNQAIRRGLQFIGATKISASLDESSDNISKVINFEEFKDKIIYVECERHGTHDFNSVEIAKEISLLFEHHNVKTSREAFDTNVYIYINEDQALLGIDYSRRDLSKREYRIFIKPTSLKGTIAYALLKFANYKPGEKLLNPHCGSGEISIEAALYGIKKPVNFYQKDFVFSNEVKKEFFDEIDKKTLKKIENIHCFDQSLSNVSNAKKNAKIAGVDKIINFSKLEDEWMDAKFDKGSVDKIICRLSSPSKKISQKSLEKQYKEFFYQSEYILKDDGLITVCCLKSELIKEFAEKHKLQLKEEHEIFSGQQQYKICLFTKVFKQK